jgi:CheY-like chemotaxis protein
MIKRDKMTNPVQKKPLEILLVDDEESILNVQKRIIELVMNGRECSVDTAQNGAIALEKVRANKGYDLIITDYRMSIMDGIEFYKGLRAVNPEQQARVVMFSADDLNHIRKIVENSLGPEDHKPLPVYSKNDNMINSIRDIVSFL